jgi:hypothetical protein
MSTCWPHVTNTPSFWWWSMLVNTDWKEQTLFSVTFIKWILNHHHHWRGGIHYNNHHHHPDSREYLQTHHSYHHHRLKATIFNDGPLNGMHILQCCFMRSDRLGQRHTLRDINWK